MDHSSDSRFSTGVPVGGREAANGLRLFGAGVLDVLRLVEDHVAPRHLSHVVRVASRQAVGADDHVVCLRRRDEILALGALAPVMHHHAQARPEAHDLALPVADDGGGADHQRRPDAILGLLALAQQQGDGLDRLAQPHVVGQASAQAPLA